MALAEQVGYTSGLTPLGRPSLELIEGCYAEGVLLRQEPRKLAAKQTIIAILHQIENERAELQARTADLNPQQQPLDAQTHEALIGVYNEHANRILALREGVRATSIEAGGFTVAVTCEAEMVLVGVPYCEYSVQDEGLLGRVGRSTFGSELEGTPMQIPTSVVFQPDQIVG